MVATMVSTKVALLADCTAGLRGATMAEHSVGLKENRLAGLKDPLKVESWVRMMVVKKDRMMVSRMVAVREALSENMWVALLVDLKVVLLDERLVVWMVVLWALERVDLTATTKALLMVVYLDGLMDRYLARN